MRSHVVFGGDSSLDLCPQQIIQEEAAKKVASFFFGCFFLAWGITT
jgi:hypothetical protein